MFKPFTLLVFKSLQIASLIQPYAEAVFKKPQNVKKKVYPKHQKENQFSFNYTDFFSQELSGKR